MPSIKKCTTLLICLVAAFACLLGLFTVMDSSSVRAKQDEVSPPSIPQPEAFIISPTRLSASQYPDSVSTQTLWLTNTGDSLITYTIYEMTETHGLTLTDRHPFSVPRVDSDAQAHITSRGEAQVIIFFAGSLISRPLLDSQTVLPESGLSTTTWLSWLLTARSSSPGWNHKALTPSA